MNDIIDIDLLNKAIAVGVYPFVFPDIVDGNNRFYMTDSNGMLVGQDKDAYIKCCEAYFIDPTDGSFLNDKQNERD